MIILCSYLTTLLVPERGLQLRYDLLCFAHTPVMRNDKKGLKL